MNLQNSQTGFCLYISYNNTKKKIFLDIQTDFNTFLRYIKTDFNLLDAEILLFELDSDAEITSRQVLEPNSQLVIKVKEIYADNIMDNINPIIGLESLKDLEVSEDGLLAKMNEWAESKKFRLIFREGKKELKKGFKRDLFCSERTCPFKLTFKTGTTNLYRLDYDLSKKHNYHSGTRLFFFI